MVKLKYFNENVDISYDHLTILRIVVERSYTDGYAYYIEGLADFQLTGVILNYTGIEIENPGTSFYTGDTITEKSVIFVLTKAGTLIDVIIDPDGVYRSADGTNLYDSPLYNSQLYASPFFEQFEKFYLHPSSLNDDIIGKTLNNEVVSHSKEMINSSLTLSSDLTAFLTTVINGILGTGIGQLITFTIDPNEGPSTLDNMKLGSSGTSSGTTCVGLQVAGVCVGTNLAYEGGATKITGLGDLVLNSIVLGNPEWEGDTVTIPLSITMTTTKVKVDTILRAKAVGGIVKINLSPSVTVIGSPTVTANAYIVGKYNPSTFLTNFDSNDITLSSTKISLSLGDWPGITGTFKVLNKLLSFVMRGVQELIIGKISNVVKKPLQKLIRNTDLNINLPVLRF